MLRLALGDMCPFMAPVPMPMAAIWACGKPAGYRSAWRWRGLTTGTFTYCGGLDPLDSKGLRPSGAAGCQRGRDRGAGQASGRYG